MSNYKIPTISIQESVPIPTKAMIAKTINSAIDDVNKGLGLSTHSLKDKWFQAATMKLEVANALSQYSTVLMIDAANVAAERERENEKPSTKVIGFTSPAED